MDVQRIIAILIVAASAFIAIRHYWQRFSKPKKKAGSSCDDTACKGCPVKESCSSPDKEV